MKNKVVVFACGGTMGHINPAIAIAKKIAKDNDVYFVSTFKEEKNKTYETYLNEKIITDVFYFEILGFNRQKKLSIFKTFYKNIVAYFLIKKTLKKIKPDILISMGGSCGTISIYASNRKLTHLIVHEQNNVLGLGNKIVIKRVQKVLLSYPIENIKNSVVVGNPNESDYYENYSRFTQKETSILIFGGSNGADKINDFFIEINDLLKQYEVILITGKKYYEKNKEMILKTRRDNFTILPYVNNMIDYYKSARIVICRAGATTISEIMALNKNSIVIPSPNVTKNHQYFNGLYYQNKGCLKMIKESDLTVEKFFEVLRVVESEEYQKNVEQNISLNHNIYSSYLFIDEMDKVIGGANV